MPNSFPPKFTLFSLLSCSTFCSSSFFTLVHFPITTTGYHSVIHLIFFPLSNGPRLGDRSIGMGLPVYFADEQHQFGNGLRDGFGNTVNQFSNGTEAGSGLGRINLAANNLVTRIFLKFNLQNRSSIIITAAFSVAASAFVILSIMYDSWQSSRRAYRPHMRLETPNFTPFLQTDYTHAVDLGEDSTFFVTSLLPISFLWYFHLHRFHKVRYS